MMWCRKKLEEADHFVDELEAVLEDGDTKKAAFKLSAFLTAIASISDHALQDALETFGLDISLESRNIRRDFREEVLNNIENEALVSFFREWEHLRFFLEDSHAVRVRSQNVHRRIPAIAREFYPPPPEDEDEEDEHETDRRSEWVDTDVWEFYSINNDYAPMQEECRDAIERAEVIVRYTEEFLSIVADGRSEIACKTVPTMSARLAHPYSVIKRTRIARGEEFNGQLSASKGKTSRR